MLRTMAGAINYYVVANPPNQLHYVVLNCPKAQTGRGIFVLSARAPTGAQARGVRNSAGINLWTRFRGRAIFLQGPCFFGVRELGVGARLELFLGNF